MTAPGALIGRDAELARLRVCVQALRNVLLEGPVGVGKTRLAVTVAGELGRPVFRVDGDGRYSEQKLTGWFDPPAVIQKGYTAETFVPGPLVEAMRRGGVLFINELNRLPEGVQNVLLPAIDERVLVVPRLGEIRAQPGFLVVATQNPQEFVATSHLSEAILDRFELVVLDYQSEAEELAIVRGLVGPGAESGIGRLTLAAVRLARLTRGHPRVRRGASVRAAISIAEIGSVSLGRGTGLEESFVNAALMALPTRIEIEREGEGNGAVGPREEIDRLIREWAKQVFDGLSDAHGAGAVKKKS